MAKEGIETGEEGFVEEPRKDVFAGDEAQEEATEEQHQVALEEEEQEAPGEEPEEETEPKPDETQDPEKPKGLVPEAPVTLLPAHFTNEGKTAFDKLLTGKADPKEAPQLMVALAKEVATTERNRTALLDRHVGELVKLKQFANEPSNVAALDYLSRNPDAQEAIGQFLMAHQQAKQSGSKDALADARKVLSGGTIQVQNTEEVFSRLEKFEGLTPEEQQEEFYKNPQMLKDFVGGLKALRQESRAAKDKVSEALQPIQALSQQAKATQNDMETFQGLVGGLPDDWRTSPEIINELDAILKADGPKWKESGKTVEQVFEKAVDRVHGILAAKTARKEGAEEAKTKTTAERLKRVGVHGDTTARKPTEKQPWDENEGGKDVYSD